MTGAGMPRVRFVDHLHVLALLGWILLGLVPYAVIQALGLPFWPLLRARLRRQLASQPDRPADVPLPDVAAWAGRTVFVLAGEPSGDRLAAPVVAQLRALVPSLRLRGYAGPACGAAGVVLDRDLTPHAVVGVIPVLRTLGFWWKVAAEFRALLRTSPPDLLLTVDFPGLNVRLARWARRRGVRTVHLVAPAVWAHSVSRVVRWRAAMDRVLALFPHEPALLAGLGLPTIYVGHPLFEAPLAPPATTERWPGAEPACVELLPGSRRGEIAAQAALLLEAARRVESVLPQLTFVMRLADEQHRAALGIGLAQARARPTRLRVDVGPQPLPHPLLGAIASSGTVTAELAAALVPLVVVYRVSVIARVASWLWLTAPWFALVNLIAGRVVARERLLTFRGGGPRLAQDLLEVVGTPEAWDRARAALRVVRTRLELPRVAERAARACLSLPPRSSGGLSAAS